MDGDTIFGLATGAVALASDADGILRTPDSRASHLNRLFETAADVFAVACVDAVVNARSIGTATAYRDLCPSAWR